MSWTPDPGRYDSMPYARCGSSGLRLPRIALGLWHNFGSITPFAQQQAMLHTAFDHGITYFDLANNYGPPYGEAERNFGRHLRRSLAPCRDELIIATKAGYDMWPGPYGSWGSRKSLMASLDQSLARMRLDYVDIFYHHRPDPETPLEETMDALADIVHMGKALYVGVSRYSPEQTREAARLLELRGVRLLVHQPRYSMLTREIEGGLTDALRALGVGCAVFSPLAGGRLTGKYRRGIPADSRAGHDARYLKPEMIEPRLAPCTDALSELAAARGQTLTQLALQWVLRDPVVTTAIIGASRPEQITENIKALEGAPLTDEELETIDAVLTQYDAQG